MPAPGSGGPFYFAWCDADDTTFGAGFYRYDEPIFSFSLVAEEGQAATLEIEVENPWIDAPTFKYIAPGNQFWAWFAWYNEAEDAVEPLFFGRLVGVPDNIQGYTVRLQFVALSDEWVTQRQILADSLKVLPKFDPVFIDPSARNDLDAVLEGYSALPHIDPITHAWSTSDILTGEDGTLVIDASDTLTGVRSRLTGNPLAAVRVNADVGWSQIDSGGSVFIGAWHVRTYAGGSFISAWPKTGTSLGGGWSAQASAAIDAQNIDNATTMSITGGFTDQSPRHNDGDAISGQTTVSFSSSPASGPGYTVSESGHAAIIGDDYADPSSSYSVSKARAALYEIPCWLYAQYEANRQRKEVVSFTLSADLQPIRSATGGRRDVENLSLSSVDLSAPLWEPKSRALLDSVAVQLGQLIAPSVPATVAGSLDYQICVDAGTCAATEPDYSDDIGVETLDGTASFVSVGPNLPDMVEWTPETYIALGAVCAPTPPIWVWRSALAPYAGYGQSSGGVASEGMVIRDDRTLSYHQCITSGSMSLFWPGFLPIAGAVTVDGTAVWIGLGMYVPGGAFQICTTAGITNATARPPFRATAGETVTDGGVVWTSLGAGGPSLSIPAGGVPGRVVARSWFPTDRGLRGVEHLIMRAAARLRSSARAVETEVVCPFKIASLLSLRKNATIVSPMHPAGGITGKIISYTLSGEGDSGEFTASIKLGSSIGNGGTETLTAGTGVYADPGYMDAGYQQMAGASVSIDDAVSYTPPVDQPNDDGLTFPLTRDQVVLRADVNGNLALQEAAVVASFPTRLMDGTLSQPVNGQNDAEEALASQLAGSRSALLSLDAALNAFNTSIYVAIDLKPVTGQSFAKTYSLDVSDLKIPKMVDLAEG